MQAAEAARDAREKETMKIKKNAQTMREESQQYRMDRKMQIEKAMESKREIHSKVVKDRDLVQNSVDKMAAQRRAKAEIVALERAIAVRQYVLYQSRLIPKPLEELIKYV